MSVLDRCVCECLGGGGGKCVDVNEKRVWMSVVALEFSQLLILTTLILEQHHTETQGVHQSGYELIYV